MRSTSAHGTRMRTSRRRARGRRRFSAAATAPRTRKRALPGVRRRRLTLRAVRQNAKMTSCLSCGASGRRMSGRYREPARSCARSTWPTCTSSQDMVPTPATPGCSAGARRGRMDEGPCAAFRLLMAAGTASPRSVAIWPAAWRSLEAGRAARGVAVARKAAADGISRNASWRCCARWRCPRRRSDWSDGVRRTRPPSVAPGPRSSLSIAPES